MTRKTLILSALLCLWLATGHAQTLKRLGGIGAGFAPVNDSVAAANFLTPARGLQVLKILPGGTAEALGVQVNDIVLSINGQALTSPAGITANKVLTKHDGEPVTWVLWRKKKEVTLQGIAKPRPYETSTEFDIVYDQYAFQGGQVRCIISKPKTAGKKPAILLIQGYPCATVDYLPAWHPHKQLADEFTRRGYVVMRAEKPGLGDCSGTPDCYDIDFFTETENFKTAYLKMKSLPEVDTNRLFIFGHSMGGMEAPFIASEVKPKGVIVYGVSIKSWHEYLLDMLRYQNPNFGIDYLQVDREMRTYDTLLYSLFIQNRKPSELIQEHPHYKALLERDFEYVKGDDFLGRSIVFSTSLHSAKVYEAWSQVTCHVLSAHGDYDIQTVDDFSQKELVKIVNRYHPGMATYLPVAETDHGLVKLSNEQLKWDMYNIPGMFVKLYSENGINLDAVGKMDEWMKGLK